MDFYINRIKAKSPEEVIAAVREGKLVEAEGSDITPATDGSFVRWIGDDTRIYFLPSQIPELFSGRKDFHTMERWFYPS